MAFQLSDVVNKDKMYLVKRTELEGRLDPLYYVEKNQSRCFIKLGKIAKISGGKRLPLGSDFATVITPYRYLRVGDIDWHGNLDHSNFNYLSETTYNTLKQYEITDNELLITIVGATIGKVALLQKNSDEKIILTENCAKISIIAPTVLPEYLLAILQSSFVQKQIQLNYIQTTLPKLGLERLKSLKIPPVPDLAIQSKIVAMLETAYSAKKQKETQSQQLLDSIDSYLLHELGIDLPAEEENSISQRMFVRKFSEVSGGRFDPAYFEKRFANLICTIQKSAYQFVPLATVCNLLCSGKTPARDEYSEDPTAYPVIKVASYQGDLIALNKTDFAVSQQPYSVEKGDIFVLSAAHQPDYVGRFVKQLDDDPRIPTSFVGELICLRANSAIINPNYLFGLFTSNTFQTLMNREKRGQTSHIYSNDIKHILIPLPPLEKQNEIAAHIQTIRDQAKQLRAEAAAGLEKARQEVEAMILKKDSNQCVKN